MAATTKKRTKKILIRIGIGILSTIVLLAIVIGIALNTVVTPKRITPIILDMAHQYVDAEVKCESIDITFFSTFPDLGIIMQNGHIVNNTMAVRDSLNPSTAQDTLLSFRQITFSLNPVAFIFDQKVILNKLEVENADIYAFVNAEGKANWDIFVSPETVEAEQDTTAFKLPELNISDIRLRNINLTYDDLQQDAYVAMDSIRMRLDGNMSKEHANLNLAFRTTGITSYYQGQTYTTNLPFGIRTRLDRDRVAKTLVIDRGNITVGILQLKAQGNIVNNANRDKADMDIHFTLDASSLAEVLQMIPAHTNDYISRIIARGNVASQGKLAGSIGQGQYPTVSWSLQLTDGSISSQKQPDKPLLNHINLDFHTFLDLTGKQPSSFKLNNLDIQSTSSKLNVKGNFDDILTRPTIDAQAKADINFTQMARNFTFLEDMNMGGMIDFDISAKCLLDDVLAANLGKINANGTANISNLNFAHLKENFSIYASKAAMRFGTNTKDSVRGRLRESLLRGNISLDSLNVNWKDEILANAGKVSARFSTSEPKDTSSIAPVITNATAGNLQINMGDSVRLKASRTSVSARVVPSKANPALPEINLRFALDTVRGRYTTTGAALRNAKLSIKLNRTQPRARRQRTRPAGDSINVQTDSVAIQQRRNRAMSRAQRDSIRLQLNNPETNVSFRLESQETRNLLRKWDVTGSLACTSMHIRTPYLPLPMRMKETDMTFTTNTLKVEKADMQVGASAFSLKGDIEGIRRALLFNGKVAAKFTLTADSIDFNQLIKAAVAGSEYTQKSTIEKDSISTLVLDDTQAIPVDVDTIPTGIFVVPRNLDIEFNSRIRNAKFADINIRNARGRIILRDQAIQLPRFNLNSDIGTARMTMVYKAINSKGAHLGMDLNVTRMDLKELIESVPMIDELTPMLRSFEGVVDCDMTAVTELDSTMTVILPQTTASAHIRGKDMVLLDGETFSEISKTLRFKNKNRNLIDSISVEMIMEDEKLMIFPFQISIDRYSVGVGGVQNLDMTFDYHITVLKSPLPFKVGLNVSGDVDNMKIRLAKAKYKDLFTVARQKDLANTVINVRQEMDEKLRKSINEIVGSDLRRPVQRPRSSLPDSLRRGFFQLDTTEVKAEELTDTITVAPE